jgi:hypothetical protein
MGNIKKTIKGFPYIVERIPFDYPLKKQFSRWHIVAVSEAIPKYTKLPCTPGLQGLDIIYYAKNIDNQQYVTYA